MTCWRRLRDWQLAGVWDLVHFAVLDWLARDICDGRGVPFAIRLTSANRNDSQEALALVDAIPPLQGERGRRGGVRTVCSGIAATTRRRFGSGCAGVGFARSW